MAWDLPDRALAGKMTDGILLRFSGPLPPVSLSSGG